MMFFLKKILDKANTIMSAKKISLACCLDQCQYSFSAFDENNVLTICYYKTVDLPNQVVDSLTNDVERFDLIGSTCQLILCPGQYQLLLLDAPKVPKEDMAAALRWELTGLTEYLIDDILIDVFPIPASSKIAQKVFVALTSKSALMTTLNLFEKAYLDVVSVGISEFALRNFMIKMIPQQAMRYEAPILVMSLNGSFQKIYLIFCDHYYLIRELILQPDLLQDKLFDVQTVVSELKRSIDYCLSQFSMREPKKIIFTPSVYYNTAFLDAIGEATGLDVINIDLNKWYQFKQPMQLNEQCSLFYSLSGAINEQIIGSA